MVAIRKTQEKTLADRIMDFVRLHAVNGIYNAPESREHVDFKQLIADHANQRRALTRDVSVRAADKWVFDQYRSLFQGDPTAGMSAPFVSCRITTYLSIIHRLNSGEEVTRENLRDFKASWGEWATKNDCREFDAIAQFFFQAELLRRKGMTTTRKRSKKGKTIEEVNKM